MDTRIGNLQCEWKQRSYHTREGKRRLAISRVRLPAHAACPCGCVCVSPTLLWLSSPSLLDAQLTAHRQANPAFRSAQVSAFNTELARSFVRDLPMVFADTFPLTSLRQPEKPDDGVHSIWAATQTAQSLAAFLECSYPETPVE